MNLDVSALRDISGAKVNVNVTGNLSVEIYLYFVVTMKL